MRALRLSVQFAAFTVLFVFLACTSTKFSDTWKDVTYKGPPKKILVINMFQEPSTRRLFEDEIVMALKDYNVDAVVKYTVAPPDQLVFDKDAIAAQAKEVDADTVLIARSLGARRDPPGTGTRDSYINIRVDIYDMRSNKFISFVTAETPIRQTGIRQFIINDVPSFVSDLVDELSRLGLF
jgi:hypothetical protein